MKESNALIQFKDGVELLKNGYPKDAFTCATPSK